MGIEPGICASNPLSSGLLPWVNHWSFHWKECVQLTSLKLLRKIGRYHLLPNVVVVAGDSEEVNTPTIFMDGLWVLGLCFYGPTWQRCTQTTCRDSTDLLYAWEKPLRTFSFFVSPHPPGVLCTSIVDSVEGPSAETAAKPLQTVYQTFWRTLKRWLRLCSVIMCDSGSWLSHFAATSKAIAPRAICMNLSFWYNASE